MVVAPSVSSGQIVHGIGPEHRGRPFAGVLDMIGMTKVTNSIPALNTAVSRDWDAQENPGWRCGWENASDGWSRFLLPNSRPIRESTLIRRVGV